MRIRIDRAGPSPPQPYGEGLSTSSKASNIGSRQAEVGAERFVSAGTSIGPHDGSGIAVELENYIGRRGGRGVVRGDDSKGSKMSDVNTIRSDRTAPTDDQFG